MKVWCFSKYTLLRRRRTLNKTTARYTSTISCASRQNSYSFPASSTVVLTGSTHRLWKEWVFGSYCMHTSLWQSRSSLLSPHKNVSNITGILNDWLQRQEKEVWVFTTLCKGITIFDTMQIMFIRLNKTDATGPRKHLVGDNTQKSIAGDWLSATCRDGHSETTLENSKGYSFHTENK